MARDEVLGIFRILFFIMLFISSGFLGYLVKIKYYDNPEGMTMMGVLSLVAAFVAYILLRM